MFLLRKQTNVIQLCQGNEIKNYLPLKEYKMVIKQ